MVSGQRHGYQQLEVYQRSLKLVRPIHQLVSRFPDFERFELAAQMRRACKSIPANIAEGHGKRTSPKDFTQLIRYWRGMQHRPG